MPLPIYISYSTSKATAEGLQSLRAIERLLDTVADAAGVILRLDQRDWDFGFVIEDVVDAFPLAARDAFSTDNDSALGKAYLLPGLQQLVPAGLAKGRGDELGADLAF